MIKLNASFIVVCILKEWSVKELMLVAPYVYLHYEFINSRMNRQVLLELISFF
jgi:hypothetical protein